jgi:hypothetical protein
MVLYGDPAQPWKDLELTGFSFGTAALLPERNCLKEDPDIGTGIESIGDLPDFPEAVRSSGLSGPHRRIQ